VNTDNDVSKDHTETEWLAWLIESTTVWQLEMIVG